MIPFAHVGGVPIEEMLPALVGMGGGIVGVRVWLAMAVRRDRERER